MVLDVDFPNIVILTGAGISAESGLGTFRDKDGLWNEYDLDEVATPEGFAKNPDLVHDFYSARRENLRGAKHNPAHTALARLEKQHKGNVLIVTQNVDDLHEQAGSKNVLHMHGELMKARCLHCEDVMEWRVDMSRDDVCPSCQTQGKLRPHIVWFGEMPFYMDRIELALASADLFISIGTSGNVYPAAGFIQGIRQYGHAHTVELNLEPSEGSGWFEEAFYGPASEVVPAFIDELLSS